MVLNHRTNVLNHALPRDSKIAHPSDRVLGSNPKTGPETRAPEITDLSSSSAMLHAMSKMTVGARELGKAADILTCMFKDKSNYTILTMSGAASMGQLDLIIAELIDSGYIKCIVCTGAIITHGASLESGSKMFQIEEEEVDEKTDTALYNRGYNRVFDTVELEKALDNTCDLVMEIMDNWDQPTISSYELHSLLGKCLCNKYPEENGILHAAYRAGIPVIVPAFTDSEIGLSYAQYLMKGGKCMFDTFADLNVYANLCRDAECLSILTLGGGVPRNWAQQIAPFFDTLIDRKLLDMTPKRFKYGVRICPEFTEWGGLSGCTYSEGMSWGKFVPKSEGGCYSEVYSDYTSVFPLLIKGVLERCG